MNRRVILSGIAALAGTSALAQSNPAPATDSPAAATPAPNPPAPASAPAMKVGTPLTLSDGATKHIKDTLVAGSLSLAVSRLAEPKIKHLPLKQFAGFEIAEQETIADILTRMMMPGGPPTGTAVAPTNAALSANLDAEGKATIEKMRAMKAGPDFDRAYVGTQIKGHKALLAIQDAYLAAPDLVGQTDVAKLARGMIKEHLALLDDLKKLR